MSPATVAIAPVEASSCLAVAMQDEQCSTIEDYTTHLHGDFKNSQNKDPYEPTSIMECHKGFECCSDVFVVVFQSTLQEFPLKFTYSMPKWGMK